MGEPGEMGGMGETEEIGERDAQPQVQWQSTVNTELAQKVLDALG